MKLIIRAVVIALAYAATGFGVMLGVGNLHDWDHAVPTMGFWAAVGVAIPILIVAVVIRAYYGINDDLNKL